MLEDLPNPSFAPGKTGPRLWEDLLQYSPQIKGANILARQPPKFEEGKALSTPGHKHTLSQLTDDCVLPFSDVLDISKSYNVAAICDECRLHFNIEVKFTKNKKYDDCSICPVGDPLHHFRYEVELSEPVDLTKQYPQGRWVDKLVFSCSGPACPTIVTITTKAPILSPELTSLLVDPEALKARMKYAQESFPHFFAEESEIVPTQPYNALATLLTYIKNAKSRDQRPIPSQNLKFVTNIGRDAAVLLKLAGFTNSEEGETWKPPSLEMLDNPESGVFKNMQDMLEEIMILMDKRKPNYSKPDVRQKIVRANKEIKRLLGNEKYPCTSSNWTIDLTIPEHPYYAGIGAVGDFADPLVFWAFERQSACDPDNKPYYFQCFENIAGGRLSEMLNIEVAKARSEGAYTLAELSASYEYFGIDPGKYNSDETFIIGSFESRVRDAPVHEHQARANLRIIGHALKSQRILNASDKVSIRDINTAYDWLNVTSATPDDFILSTYKVRVGDNAMDESTGKEALKIIAEARQSHVLLTFLETGAIETPVETGAAYARLGIDDRSVSDDLVISVFNFRLQDDPKRMQELRAALRAIASSRDSAKIKNFLETGQSDQPIMGSADSPVGIENIGNTCYLNSLLQFYFTVRPLRDMILDIDNFQEMEVTDEVIERKRVGGRKVTAQEVERAKRFVRCLRTLYQNLIVSAQSSVTPERELAYLALVSSKDEAEDEVRRGSMTAMGPAPPLINVTDESDKMEIDQKPMSIPEATGDDDASEATLVNDDPPPPYSGPNEEDYVMVNMDTKPTHIDNKENYSPKTEGLFGFVGPLRPPLQGVDLNEGSGGFQKGKEVEAPLTPPPEVPNRPPPPIPPRPKREDSSKVDMMMFGKQQDVTECIGNVLFQLEAAIKPEEIDENGEQIDIVKRLFYGKTKQTLTFPNSAETRIKEELFSHLLVNVAEGDRDIYSALDSSFDIEQVDLEGREARRYLSISHLPPILQIQVQRVQFDRARSAAYKSNSHLKFDETIYLDRYIDTNNQDLKERREKSWQWKEELKILERRKISMTKTQAGVKLSEALDLTREWLSGIDSTEDDMEINPTVLAELEERSKAMRRELEVLEQDIKDRESRINSQFTDMRKHGYRIHSVFIHRGSATFGHYWIYIYDYQKKVFRKYNDGYVTEVSNVAEVFTHDSNNNPPTPYFLVFVKEEECTTLMEAVRREIIMG